MTAEHKKYKERQLDKAIQREDFSDKVFAKKVKDFHRREDIESIHNTGNIFIIIFSFMLLVLLMRILMNPNAPIPSFASLLEFLQGTTTINIPMIPTENIGIPFFEYFVNLINVAIFITNGALQIIMYIFTFLGWILGTV